MNQKTKFLPAVIILTCLLCGCNKSDIKTIKAPEFTDLIFDGTTFLPNNDFVWNMSKEDFLSRVYRADIFDPDNENFNGYRYFHSDETKVTTFTPMTLYSVGKIPGQAEAIYAFNEEGLFKSGYVWYFKDEKDKAEKAQEAVAILVEDFNSNKNIVENQIDIPDLSDADNMGIYTYEWSLTASPQGYIELAILNNHERQIIIEVTVGIL